MASSYTRFISQIIGQLVLRTGMGEKLIGSIGIAFDKLAEASNHAIRSSWVGSLAGGPAYDALQPAGNELSLKRYPNESWTQYHNRIQRVWDDMLTAGHESSILNQLAAAGFPGARIYYVTDWPTFITSWSQFTVFFPQGTHPVIGAGPIIGGFTVGDGTTIGPLGLSASNLLAMRRLIKRFKPGHWVCRAIIFEISGWTIGDGHTVGESDLVIGGSHAVVGVV